ncbi:MAG: response regulator transcription factor [Acidobacteria bacterium]|nr:response regulator transcription factor [Acidobacteriota bacterium]MBV9144533.1 response regulator transcription factor [Acidobacteriota bacterium]MBV9435596.1 response regulator transcription factor [Acidobacteriota bacterium]
MNERILIVEDEEALRMTLSDRLRSEGYEIETAADGAAGLQKATEQAYDLVLLDVMLPRKSGLDVCKDIRAAGMAVPILMLTAKGQNVDKIVGLKIGADDYVTKPFDTTELLARIEALLRRASAYASTRPAVQKLGDLQIDIPGTMVKRDGERVALSAREFQLLRYLLEHRNTTMSRANILKDVWGYSSDTFTRTVDVHVASLRQKIETDPKQPKFILTVPGLGYKLAA